MSFGSHSLLSLYLLSLLLMLSPLRVDVFPIFLMTNSTKKNLHAAQAAHKSALATHVATGMVTVLQVKGPRWVVENFSLPHEEFKNANPKSPVWDQETQKKFLTAVKPPLVFAGRAQNGQETYTCHPYGNRPYELEARGLRSVILDLTISGFSPNKEIVESPLLDSIVSTNEAIVFHFKNSTSTDIAELPLKEVKELLESCANSRIEPGKHLVFESKGGVKLNYYGNSGHGSLQFEKNEFKLYNLSGHLVIIEWPCFKLLNRPGPYTMLLQQAANFYKRVA